VKLTDLLTEDQRERVEILAVSVDDAADLDRMVRRIEDESGGSTPDFPFLSDPGSRVIDRYGLRNPDDERGIPHPTTLVIDEEGVVRWKFVETDYRVRPTDEMILEALLEVEGGTSPG
jgi:peroxiredoxin